MSPSLCTLALFLSTVARLVRITRSSRRTTTLPMTVALPSARLPSRASAVTSNLPLSGVFGGAGDLLGPAFCVGPPRAEAGVVPGVICDGQGGSSARAAGIMPRHDANRIHDG